MMVDTDVLIWYLRGHERARRVVERLGTFAVSAVTYMELVQGMRNRDELRILRRTFADWGTRVLPITEGISARAVVYVEQHFLSHQLLMADALIAATTVLAGDTLLTANAKHYRPVAELELSIFRP